MRRAIKEMAVLCQGFPERSLCVHFQRIWRQLIADSNDAIRAEVTPGVVDTVVGRGSSRPAVTKGRQKSELGYARDVMYTPDSSLIIADSYNAQCVG